MKITDIKTIPLRSPSLRWVPELIEDTRNSSKKVMSRQGLVCCIVKIFTDEGITGVGESISRAVPEATTSIIKQLFKPILLGEDPENVEFLWERMFDTLGSRGHTKGHFFEAIGGVDCALWDIIGKMRGEPVYKVLGGSHRERIKVYGSSVFFGNTETVSRRAVELVEKGHDQMKLKISSSHYGLKPEADIENVIAVRDAVGYDVDLLLDANCGYNVRIALKVGRKFEKYECYYMEEPIPTYDIDGYARLSKTLDLPICAGECHFSKYDFKDLIMNGHVDIINPDIARTGGFTETRKILVLAEAFEVGVAPHTGSSGAVQEAATCHLSSIIPSRTFTTQEYWVYRSPIQFEILRESVAEYPTEGYLKLSKKPGLGIELDEEALQKYRATPII